MKELWDAYDEDGNQLGFDLVRGEPVPEGVYHIVVEICTVTENKEILITQRHESKPFGLKWEITGGSALKGETAEQGAVRELREETGIQVAESDLHFVYSYLHSEIRSVYKCFIVFIKKENTNIQLQQGETVDYRFLPYGEFKEFIRKDFAGSSSQRFYLHEDRFDSIIMQK